MGHSKRRSTTIVATPSGPAFKAKVLFVGRLEISWYSFKFCGPKFGYTNFETWVHLSSAVQATGPHGKVAQLAQLQNEKW